MTNPGLEMLRRGQWGFTFTVPPAAFGLFAPGQRFETELMSVNQYEGLQRYTIVLNSMRYSGGLLLAPGVSADNQVDSRFGIELQWGANESTDSCDVDYPCRGGSFCIAAEYIRVRLFRDATGAAIGPAPTVSGFVSPSTKLVTALVPPTRTQQVTLGASSNFQMPVPPRAVAYRLMLGSQTDVLAFALQVQGDGASGGFADAVGATGTGTETFQQNRWAYRPLLPSTQFISLTSGAAGATAILQFMLDLG